MISMRSLFGHYSRSWYKDNSGDVKINCLIELQRQNDVKIVSSHYVESPKVVTPNSKNLPQCLEVNQA